MSAQFSKGLGQDLSQIAVYELSGDSTGYKGYDDDDADDLPQTYIVYEDGLDEEF